MRILHITPHLGGGIGTVILNWIKYEIKNKSENVHHILCLDRNKNDLTEHTEQGITIQEKASRHLISVKGAFADIIILHWYNHPLIFDLLCNFEFPHCRLIIWNHVSGLYLPYIHSEKLIDFSDKFVFTSPVSYECREIKYLNWKIKQKLDVVWSSFGSELYGKIKRIPHDNFIVGITGTMDYGKLSRNFISLCAQMVIPNVEFIVCSGDSQEHLKQEARDFGIYDKFSFKGRVPDVKKYLCKYDVFGYPLQPQHFGTCEQAIGEAMLCGVVPVVLNNPAENYIVRNGEDGIIANSFPEYIGAVEYLAMNEKERQRMSLNAMKNAREKYSMEKKVKAWNIIFEEIMKFPKNKRYWKGLKKRKYSTDQIFVESLGDFGSIFNKYFENNNDEYNKTFIKDIFRANPMWYSNNKGSVRQYLEFFSYNYNLKSLLDLMDNIE